MIAPVLHTSRLRLRPHMIEDFDAYAALFASDRASHMGTLTRKHAWYSFASDIAQWALLGHGAWAMEDRATGTFQGQVSILKPDHFPETELGWFVFDHAEGKGLAYEAAVAARDFARSHLSLQSLVSYIAPANARSIRLAERLGAQLDPNAVGEDDDDLVYRHSVAA